MFKVAVGHSEDPYSIDAITEAIEKCEKVLGENKPIAGIVFISPDYDHKAILRHIMDKFPGLELIGCTSSSEVSSSLGYVEGSLLLTLFSSDRIKIYADVVRDISKEGHREEFQAAIRRTLDRSTEEPKLCLTFPDITTLGAVQVIREMGLELGKTFPIVGGGASDMRFKFTENSQFYKTEVLHDSAPFLIFSGPVRFEINSASGWEPFTAKQNMSSHKKDVVYKVGDDTALDYFKHYLGGEPTLANPLAIFEEGQDEFYLRASIGVNEKDGAITVAGEIPAKNIECSIAKAEPEIAINIMKELIEKTKASKPSYDCAFVTSCACRPAVMGTKIREEGETIKEAYSDDIPCFGFYSYGQIGPFETGGKPFVHNVTVVTLALGEE